MVNWFFLEGNPMSLVERFFVTAEKPHKVDGRKVISMRNQTQNGSFLCDLTEEDAVYSSENWMYFATNDVDAIQRDSSEHASPVLNLVFTDLSQRLKNGALDNKYIVAQGREFDKAARRILGEPTVLERTISRVIYELST